VSGGQVGFGRVAWSVCWCDRVCQVAGSGLAGWPGQFVGVTGFGRVAWLVCRHGRVCRVAGWPGRCVSMVEFWSGDWACFWQ